MSAATAVRMLAAAAAIGLAPATHAQLFKCVQPDGKVVYQDRACEERARQSTVREPAPGPVAAPKAEAPGDESRPAPAAAPQASGGAVETVAAYTVCAERVPNFAFKYAGAYEGWKARNALGYARLASEPDASRLDERLRAERERPEGPPMADYCAGVATALQPPATASTPN